jgi:hypothetical protein
MPTFYRRDDWVTDAMGNAQSGAGIYVCSQPATAGYINKAGAYVPPSPLVQLYADPNGATPLTQPVQTDGYGHAFYYVAPGTYTVTYYSPWIVQTTLADQVITALFAGVTATAPNGVVNGTNVEFTLPSVPTNFSMIFLNGVLQVPGTNYSITGATISFYAAPESGDQLFALYA